MAYREFIEGDLKMFSLVKKWALDRNTEAVFDLRKGCVATTKSRPN